MLIFKLPCISWYGQTALSHDGNKNDFSAFELATQPDGRNPSDENAMELTELECLSRGFPMGSPVCIPQTNGVVPWARHDIR